MTVLYIHIAEYIVCTPSIRIVSGKSRGLQRIDVICCCIIQQQLTDLSHLTGAVKWMWVQNTEGSSTFEASLR